MSTAEIDLARHEREEDRRASADADFWARFDAARETLDSGGDHDTHCDQDSAWEQIADHEATQALVQRLWSAQSDYDRNVAARELQEHCSRIVDEMVTKRIEIDMRRAEAA